MGIILSSKASRWFVCGGMSTRASARKISGPLFPSRLAKRKRVRHRSYPYWATRRSSALQSSTRSGGLPTTLLECFRTTLSISTCSPPCWLIGLICSTHAQQAYASSEHLQSTHRQNKPHEHLVHLSFLKHAPKISWLHGDLVFHASPQRLQILSRLG